MSWGTELWDQYENIEKHTQQGIDFADKYSKFVKDRCKIEQDYAQNLRRLAKNYQPKKKDEDSRFTYSKSFLAILNEVDDIAGQHEVIAENMTSLIYKEMQTMCSNLKVERKKIQTEGSKVQEILKQYVKDLEHRKKQYENTHKQADTATLQYQKADADDQQTKAQVEKARSIMNTKKQICEDCKNEYLVQLEKTNDLQQQHYATHMPAVFQQFQTMDEQRIDQLAQSYRTFADVERRVMPIIGKCLDGITSSANKVNHTTDSQLVIERFKTGHVPPDDFAFEDANRQRSREMLGSSGSNSSGGALSQPSSTRSSTFRGAGTDKGRNKKRTGLFGLFGKNEEHKEDFSHLPPNQQKKKLQEKIEEINDKLNQEIKKRDGMLKMKDVYTKNPSLGNPANIESQLAEVGKTFDAYRLELQKYQSYMSQAEGRGGTPTGTPKEERKSRRASNGIPNRDYSELDVPHPTAASPTSPGISQPARITSPNTTASSYQNTSVSSPEVADTSMANLSAAYTDDEFADDDELEPAIAKCRALYSFEATSEGAIPLTEGEIIEVMENDSDGWTKVRKGNLEGYVPTSYIELFH